ncbi:hypothetical protein B0T22DRAFT_496311 [Podospora appendiculata]|uniref:Fumarylacetoacetase-like C-terminal domain-containing protein n=1 Tax=Podospora appendiculata TaxID=314037 RepID=A0AAE0XHI6_9PEZI|nr:hypothetical protein B0T22DRAFT_496311 [Podospora appendiculata]
MSPFRSGFVAKDGFTYFGDAIMPRGVTDIAKAKQARILTGNIFDRYKSNMPIPRYPILFYKPATALGGPTDPIPVPPLAQEAAGLDYECELVAIIGKACLNVPEHRALDHVFGYAVGNDVSIWSLGKGFDGWALFGPGIVSSRLIKDPQTLKITTRVNGELVQESSTADMIFSLKKTIAFLSQGTSLLPGDVIFTGTPQGVGMGKSPPVWLKDGDIVQVELENVGTCTNRVEFDSPSPPRELKKRD